MFRVCSKPFSRNRRLTYVAAIPTALLLLGLLLAGPYHDITADTNKVEDGSFEAGRNGGVWKERSLLFGTPVCSIGGSTGEACGNGSVGGGPATAGPRTGDYWAWFGGGGMNVEKCSVTQSVKFPSGSAKLRFYLWIGADSPDGKDSLKVLIDGQKVFSVKESSTKYDSGYTLVEKDISQFADGQKHKLLFKNSCTGDGSSNFNVDDISITAI